VDPVVRFRCVGSLDPDWWEPLTITLRDDGTTSLVGSVVDASALYGLLARLRDRGATLLQVERLDLEEDP
jgi:hypothetical protein